jgi:MFS family permease
MVSEAAAAGEAADAAPRERTPRDAWWMVAVLLGFYVLSYLDRATINLLVDTLKADLSLTDFQVSLLMGPAFAIAYAALSFPFGWAVDRFPRRAALALGVACWSAFTTCCGLARSFNSLFLARIGVGGAEASLMPAAYSLIADKFPKAQLTTALSIFAMGPKTGQAASLFLGALLIQAAAYLSATTLPVFGGAKDWQIVYLLLGVPGLLMALLVWTFSDPGRRSVVAGAAAESRDFLPYVWRQRKMVGLLWLGYSVVGIVMAAFQNWTPTYLSRELHWRPAEYGPVLAMVNLLAAATMPLNGILADFAYKRGVKDAHTRVYTWLLALMAPVFAAYAVHPDRTGFLIAFWLLQSLGASFMVYMSAGLQIVTPAQLRGRISALFILGINLIGGGLGPVVTASLTDFVFHDPQRLGASIAITGFAGCLLALIALRAALKPLGAVISGERA